MKAFLAIKYYDNMQNKETIENICSVLESAGIEAFAFARNIQNYGECLLSPEQIMARACEEIKSSDIFIIEASEVSIGIGIEAGIAFSAGIPIYLIYRKNSEVSNSIKGISQKQLAYEKYEDISSLFPRTHI